MNSDDAGPTQSVEDFLGLPPEHRRSRLKKWGLAAGSAAILLLLILAFSGGSADAPRFATVELKRGDMMVQVNATGNLEPTNEVTVGSELSGLIDEVFVDVNDTVKKDHQLAQIDTEKLEDAIRRSEAALEQARAGVLQREAEVELARTSLSRAEEVHRLSDGKVPSQAELDSVRAEYKRARANLASAKASVSSAEAQLATDRTNLSRATIRSPVDGVILSRNVEPGQTLAASFNTPQLFVIAEDLTAMQLEVKVDEADVGQVDEGQPTTFTVDAYPGQTFEAVITRVNLGANNSGANTATVSASTSNVISYGAVLTVDNEDLSLRPGMTATILTSHEQDALMVPNAALRFRPSEEGGAKQEFAIFYSEPKGSGERQQVGFGRGATKTIYVLGDDSAIKAYQVRVGNSNGAWTIVSGEGLESGMNVVTGELALQQ